MGYSDKPQMVRVDFFKESGKWYTTEAVEWLQYAGCLIHDAFERSLQKHLKGRLEGMTAVCLKPYHEHSHPIMLKALRNKEEDDE